MALLDLHGYLLYVNAAFAGLFGGSTTPDAFHELDCSTLLSDELATEFRASVLPRAAASGWEGSLRLARQDLAHAELSVRLSPVPPDPGSSEVKVLAAEFVMQRRKLAAPAAPSSGTPVDWDVPILPIAHRVIVVPVAGELSARRSNVLLRLLLAAITAHRAKAVIVDVTGLAAVDERAADHLAKTVLAARLKGAKTIVSGVSQQTAEALTEINAEWKDITTVGELRTGLSLALRHVEKAAEPRRQRSASGGR